MHFRTYFDSTFAIQSIDVLVTLFIEWTMRKVGLYAFAESVESAHTQQR